jgi:hypothetical protein
MKTTPPKRITDLFFRLAIREYLNAFTRPLDCATYCYRAIEGIKSAFVSKTENDGWDDMHVALGTNRSDIEGPGVEFAGIESLGFAHGILALRQGVWRRPMRSARTILAEWACRC